MKQQFSWWRFLSTIKSPLLIFFNNLAIGAPYFLHILRYAELWFLHGEVMKKAKEFRQNVPIKLYQLILLR